MQKKTKLAIPLDMLRVIRRLEVGPVRLEPKGLNACYRVVQDHQSDDETDLIYRFEEAVFDPKDPLAINLASMIAAQVAINYGLFCDEIVFHGPLDAHDQQFIREMAENTAREIFVKKFLEPNPFLLGEAAKLPPLQLETYLRAKLLFPDAPKAKSKKVKADDQPIWDVSSSHHAVLASGGKDSLLSHALLNDIGKDVHSIFGNESGRHWLTAFNAYRYFSKHMPETMRVWMNTDRVFNWMLRHFPFVRQDFAKVRADMYPIRLWTVAVFIFGALPLLRKRGLGRLLIGDEFDTTLKLTSHGIPHYGGVYDQSVDFDVAMSNYFQKKRWGICQFSIVRPLSELLIEKILVERYPDIQAQQVSCHSAHIEGNFARPCGNCEKCRRIVSMLKALDADPGRCGYTKKQIVRCLRWFAKKGSAQESESVRQVALMLREKGILPEKYLAFDVKPQPEVLQMRFDPESSPVDAIPVDLREPLYRLMLKHANGAVERKGGAWIDVDPLSPHLLSCPYPFESLSPPAHSAPTLPEHDEPFLWGELTWPKIEERLKTVDIALLPVGSIEQHGPHLPLDTDSFDAEYLCKEVAKGCSNPKPLVLPLIPYGVSYHHEDFFGTISVTPQTLSQIVYEVGLNVAQQGITKLVIINGHGGNEPALHFAAQMINQDAHIFTCVETGETSDAEIALIAQTQNDLHAGEIETSTTLAVRAHLVDLKRWPDLKPAFSPHTFAGKRSVGWYARTARISPAGVLGDPTQATIEKGKKIWDIMIQNLIDFVDHLKGLNLNDLYEKR